MPSDTPIYKDGRWVRVTRRAYEEVYRARGWRLRPPRPTPPADRADGDPGDQPTEHKE